MTDTHFANATGLSDAAALLDRGRPRAARRGAHPRLPGVLSALLAQGIPLQQHHAVESQPAAVDRSVRRRHEDRAHRCRGLVPRSRRRSAASGGSLSVVLGARVRRRAREREPEAPELGLPVLRHGAALPVGQAGRRMRVWKGAETRGGRRASSPIVPRRCRRARPTSSTLTMETTGAAGRAGAERRSASAW